MIDLVIRTAPSSTAPAPSRWTADVGVEDGRIAAIGRARADAQEIDAAGLAVAPGLHRHPQPLRLHAAGRSARGRARSTRASRPRWSATAASAASRSATRSCAPQRSTATPTTCRSTWSVGRRVLRAARGGAAGGQRAQPRPERTAAARDARPRRPAGRRAGRAGADARPAARVARRGRLGLLDRARVRAGARRARGRADRALRGADGAASTRRTRAGATRAPPTRSPRRSARREHAEVRLQVSHLVPRNGIEESRRCIELVDAARDRGPDVAFDMHTRIFGIDEPLRRAAAWALGPADARGDPPRPGRARRACAAHRASSAPATTGRASSCSTTTIWPEYARRDLAVDRRRPRPGAARRRLRPARSAAVDELHKLMVIIHAYTEEQQREAFAHPLCVPGSDATTLAPDGPLAESFFHGAYTWASWFWRFMVPRASGCSRPADAVHRLTGAPAERLGLSDRGVAARRRARRRRRLRPGGLRASAERPSSRTCSPPAWARARERGRHAQRRRPDGREERNRPEAVRGFQPPRGCPAARLPTHLPERR